MGPLERVPSSLFKTTIVNDASSSSLMTFTSVSSSDDDNLSVASVSSVSNTSHHTRRRHHRHHQRRTARSVVFNPTVTVHDGPMVLYLSDYTAQEFTDCWYTEDDIRMIHHENDAIIEWMDDHGENISSTSFPHTRGLEAKCTVGRRARRARKADALGTVLTEQRNQKIGQWIIESSSSSLSSLSLYGADNNNNYSFPSSRSLPPTLAIAIAYAEETFPDQVEAYKRGIQDAKEAQQVDGVPHPLLNNDDGGLEHPTMYNFHLASSTTTSQPVRRSSSSHRRNRDTATTSQNRSSADDDDNTVETMMTVPSRKKKSHNDEHDSTTTAASSTSRGKKLRERFAVFLPMTNRTGK